MKYFLGLILFTFIISMIGFQIQTDYRNIHFNSIVIDTHNDVVGRVMDGEDISVKTNAGHSDLPRFLEGGVDAQIFSIFVSPGKPKKEYYSIANRQIDSIDNFVRKNEGRVVLGRSVNEIRNQVSVGEFVVMLGIEGGHAIQDDITKLDHFYKRGVRYMTLTWNNSTTWATSARDENKVGGKRKKKGLSKLGTQIVKHMNEIGMIIDISHAGEKTFWDVIDLTTKPIIASHSSVYSICPNGRNLKNEQIRAIAKNGGVICVNFAPFFIDSGFAANEKLMLKNNKRRVEEFRTQQKADIKLKDKTVLQLLEKEYSEILPSVKKLVDHIDYIAKLVGVDYVGLGSDYDGIQVAPLGMEDVTCYPKITEELVRRGYSESDIKKILGENFLRVLKHNEG
ncbi:MAG: membrane dipeptidase [Ignavibacteriales bacterium]|nr:membrane dipeptidase [Ignavibacteriales bacterium]